MVPQNPAECQGGYAVTFPWGGAIIKGRENTAGKGWDRMKHYEFVTITYQLEGMAMASLEGHREIIEEYAAKGYCYAGMVPTEVSAASGCIRKADLIFEREE